MADVNQTPGIRRVFHRRGQRTNSPAKTLTRGCQLYPSDNRALFWVTNAAVGVSLRIKRGAAAAAPFRRRTPLRDNTSPLHGAERSGASAHGWWKSTARLSHRTRLL